MNDPNTLQEVGGTWPRGFAHDCCFAWPVVRADKLVTLNYGKALLEGNRRAGRIPVYGTNGQCGWHDQRLANGPGVILGRKGMGNLGIEWTPTDYWVIDTAYYVSPKRPDVDLKFFYYLTSFVGLNHLKDGTSNPSLSRDTFYAQLLPHPPVEVQRRIANILGSLDDKIELSRRTNETLEAMARTLFRSWFVDFDPVRAKADGQKSPGLDTATAKLFPASFEPSALGPIPKGWRVGSLAETLSELETGNRPKGGVSGITSGVPSIGAESIDGLGVFDFTKTKFVPQAFFDAMGRGHVRSRDVLLYKDGGRPGMFEPHVAMFGDDFPFSVCSINEHVYRLRANDQLSQAFLYFWLSEELALAEMRVKGTGVAVPGLNSTAVRSLKVIVPPKEIVAAFDRFVEPLITAVLRNAMEQVTLTATRDALLPRLLSGEVRV